MLLEPSYQPCLDICSEPERERCAESSSCRGCNDVEGELGDLIAAKIGQVYTVFLAISAIVS